MVRKKSPKFRQHRKKWPNFGIFFFEEEAEISQKKSRNTGQGLALEAILSIDVSLRMLGHARRRFPWSEFAQAYFLGPDFVAYQGREGCFGAVVLNSCFANTGRGPAPL